MGLYAMLPEPFDWKGRIVHDKRQEAAELL